MFNSDKKEIKVYGDKESSTDVIGSAVDSFQSNSIFIIEYNSNGYINRDNKIIDCQNGNHNNIFVFDYQDDGDEFDAGNSFTNRFDENTIPENFHLYHILFYEHINNSAITLRVLAKEGMGNYILQDIETAFNGAFTGNPYCDDLDDYVSQLKEDGGFKTDSFLVDQNSVKKGKTYKCDIYEFKVSIHVKEIHNCIDRPIKTIFLN